MLGLAIGLWFVQADGRNVLRVVYDKKWVLCLFVFLANAPDIDYLPGLLQGDLNRYHHLVTHSVTWSVLFAGGTWLFWRGWDRAVSKREATFVFLAVFSHLVADALTQDGAPPYGIMVLWPLSVEYIQAPFWVFGMMAKNDLRMLFQWSNFFVMLREIVVAMPIVLLSVWLRPWFRS